LVSDYPFTTSKVNGNNQCETMEIKRLAKLRRSSGKTFRCAKLIAYDYYM
jgi:hypothetical protein